MDGGDVREIAEKAAEMLGEYGWCQFTSVASYDDWLGLKAHPRVGSMCIGGAMRQAEFEMTGGTVLWGIPGWADAVAKVILDQYPEFVAGGLDGIDLIVRWNDWPGRTVEEVVAVLENVAAEAAR